MKTTLNIEKLKKIIDEKGLKTGWLAKQIGVSRVTLYRYLSGAINPSLSTIFHLSQILNVSQETLKCDAEED